MSDPLEIALRLIYEKIDKALDDLATGNQKRAVVTLRQILPRGYRHTFEKDKP